MRLLRLGSIYGTLILAGLKGKLAYRVDFLILLVSAMLVQGMGYLFLWVVFRQIPTVAGWNLWEVVCVYALVFITEGVVSLLAEGLWRLPGILNRGEFDICLVRPVPPLLQVCASDLGLNGAGNVILGSAMIVQALSHLEVPWTPLRVAFALVLVLSAIAIRFAITLASSALTFWTRAPTASAMLLVHNLSGFARFPLPIYGRWLRGFLIAGLPFAFVSYYPAAWVFAKEEAVAIAWFTPLAAIYALAAATWLFRRGVRAYEGAGN